MSSSEEKPSSPLPPFPLAIGSFLKGWIPGPRKSGPHNDIYRKMLVYLDTQGNHKRKHGPQRVYMGHLQVYIEDMAKVAASIYQGERNVSEMEIEVLQTIYYAFSESDFSFPEIEEILKEHRGEDSAPAAKKSKSE